MEAGCLASFSASEVSQMAFVLFLMNENINTKGSHSKTKQFSRLY